MGLFGNKGRDKEMAKLTDLVRRRQSAGESQFVVPVYLMANGIGMMAMRRMQEDAIEHLSALGYSVVDLHVEEWEHTAYLRVVASGTSTAQRPTVPPETPLPPPSASAAGNVAELDPNDPSALDQWYRGALTPWKDPTLTGRTFAPGYGFEDAVSVVKRPNVVEPIFQAVAKSAADLIIELVRDGMALAEYERVLGMTVPQLRAVGVRPRHMTALMSKMDESKQALVALATMEPDRLAKWTSSQAVREECFAYHATFLGRVGRY